MQLSLPLNFPTINTFPKTKQKKSRSVHIAVVYKRSLVVLLSQLQYLSKHPAWISVERLLFKHSIDVALDNFKSVWKITTVIKILKIIKAELVTPVSATLGVLLFFVSLKISSYSCRPKGTIERLAFIDEFFPLDSGYFRGSCDAILYLLM